MFVFAANASLKSMPPAPLESASSAPSRGMRVYEPYCFCDAWGMHCAGASSLLDLRQHLGGMRQELLRPELLGTSRHNRLGPKGHSRPCVCCDKLRSLHLYAGVSMDPARPRNALLRGAHWACGVREGGVSGQPAQKGKD